MITAKKFELFSNNKTTCSQAHVFAGKLAEQIGDSYIFFCPAGMVHWCAPITLKGKFCGAILAGPVQMEKTEDKIVEDVGSYYNITEKIILEMKRHTDFIPVVNPERVRFLSEMLLIVSKEICKEETDLLGKRKETFTELARMSEAIQEMKGLEDYSIINLEKDLLNKVKLGNKEGAKRILNDILAHMYLNGEKIETMKVRVLELISMLSRAAIEGGARQDIVFGMNNENLQKIFHIKDFDELNSWLIRVLTSFINSVFEFKVEENINVISKVVTLINENYSDEISLEDIAEKVGLSASYLSRLFKKELKMNFVKYLNKTRVEESKKFLSGSNYPLAEIAVNCGFTDQSYFSKVFKRSEGITPNEYRKLNK